MKFKKLVVGLALLGVVSGAMAREIKFSGLSEDLCSQMMGPSLTIKEDSSISCGAINSASNSFTCDVAPTKVQDFLKTLSQGGFNFEAKENDAILGTAHISINTIPNYELDGFGTIVLDKVNAVMNSSSGDDLTYLVH